MMALRQAPAVQRRRVGEAVVTALSDGWIQIPTAMLHGMDEEGRSAIERAAGLRPPLPSAINAYLVQSAGRTVLIDTGAGGLMGPDAGQLQDNLRAAGVSPGKVDAVLLTHIHSDHSGGLLDAAGAPAFPAATLMVAAAEWDYWHDDAARAAAPEARRGSFDRGRHCVAPYADRAVRFSGGEVLPGIEAVALPGHTPGHTGYRIGSGAESLLVWGDIVHVAEVQCAKPEVSIGFDVDPALAVATRRAVLERVAREEQVVAGMHIGFPGFARIVRVHGGYAVRPQPWQYSLD